MRQLNSETITLDLDQLSAILREEPHSGRRQSILNLQLNPRGNWKPFAFQYLSQRRLSRNSGEVLPKLIPNQPKTCRVESFDLGKLHRDRNLDYGRGVEDR